MLIEITRKCNEECKHCMVNAEPTGIHMDDSTFIKAVKFAFDCDCIVIHLSGGDPFLHPKFFKYVRYIIDTYKNKNVIIGIQSNGWWIEDNKMCERVRKLLNHDQLWQLQISTHKDYYPNYQWTLSHKQDFINLHPKINFSYDWQGEETHLAYMGRARNFMKDKDIKGYHQCINYIQYALNLNIESKFMSNPMKDLLDFGFSRAHTCSPYIDVFGNLKLGEGNECKSIINIKNYNGVKDISGIFNSILKFSPCNNCRCLKNYSEEQKNLLNELRRYNNLPPLFKVD